ncbi:A disintegrin and metalloproteinase with thrombospondin motifs 7 [Megalops cyprinoides]|uniref:A disintegrin and metalloproteinase with thrombospondin motifs 7 n=1 Tax=Megalops cyprinoides TaxID=118141 RepID=UPI0018646DC1|nr:A disintegrin and metalloproteinase with thrombospondin motifs 7 [Megalops cyprinoides]
MLIHRYYGSNILGPTFSPANFLVAAGILSVLESRIAFGLEQKPDSVLKELAQYEIVHPSRVDARGQFVSNFVSHRVSRIKRRDAPSAERPQTRVFYQLQHGGQDLRLNLTLNSHLLAPGFLTETRYGGLDGAKIRSGGHALCHFIGEVWEERRSRGLAAISTCDGLTGLFKLSEEEFFIRPLEPAQDEGSPQAHVIYKRHIAQPSAQLIRLTQEHRANGTCGVKDLHEGGARAERHRERWEQKQQRRRIRQRSISREKWVETLVVADPKMVEYHGKGVESYVLAVMNIVSGLFRDASIGNSINIVVVRLILLEKDEEDLKISHHADNSLSSFCKWQKRLNMKGDEHPVHHDVAVLLTRKDICAAINKPCETLGLSHVAGMCQPHRSCSISEDTGLPLAFTVAHELGHNFGIQHDGSGNDCEPIGKRPFIMSPQLLYGTSPPSWSRCSRQYITRFLDRGWGWCLDDAPVRDELTLHSAPPGVLYSAAHQCRLQYGSSSLLCDDMDSVCSTLWCTVGDTCHSKLDGAVDGTRCGENKWCFHGECLPAGYRPERVDGGWAPWGEWSACSRTCSIGVQNAERDCSNPVPKNGGKYCLGERRRYRICKNAPCPTNLPSFRHIQCSHFDTMPYKGKFYKWVQVNNRVNPCELHCRPLNEYFSEKMRDAVIDGTQCYEGTSSRDVCINGICKNVGCDYEIDSNAVEDRCGVCHGNGSTCETVKKTFEKSEGLGYVDIGLIPQGARDIRIEEVAEAGNFLALRSNDPDRYFLNGGWTIQWNGDYKAAGTVFTYERTGHLENLTSPGPTLEPVWIQLLFQETNPGVRYEYTISRGETFTDSDNDIVAPDFLWQYGSWTECSATCGTGVRRQIVHCVERTSGIVEEHYCDPATRPDDKSGSCNEELCPARWWVGEWQKCSASCGDTGVTRRTVLCIRSVTLEEQRALQPSECQHLPRPEAVSPCNTHLPCPANWTTGNWSECSVTCGEGLQRRDVTCTQYAGADCDPRERPSADKPCHRRDCPRAFDDFGSDWSGSGASSREVFGNVNSIPEGNGNRLPKPGQGTTRAHPSSRDRGDLNDILEGDFSQRNRIEQTGDNYISNNVQVDDFYYDYNFIKFHEDLSYDFDFGFEKGDEQTDLGQNWQPHPSPITVKSVNTDPPTDPPAATTQNSISTPEHLPATGTVPRSVEEAPETTTAQNLGHARDQDSFPAERPAEVYPENEEEGFDSEDYFLLVSTTPMPFTSTVSFSPRWKVSIGDVDLIHDLSTAHPPVSADDGPSRDVYGMREREEPEVEHSHDALGWLTEEGEAGHKDMESHPETAGPHAPSPAWSEIDFNEILIPPLLRPRGTDPPVPDRPARANMSLNADRPTGPPGTPRVEDPPTPQPDGTAYWTTGSWSACSTSCGLGAIWRSVLCSAGNDSHCDPSKRPPPARRCYLRPCSTWRVGEWSKCSKNCGGGVKFREIQCFDTRDRRPLRPFHCQAITPRPSVQVPCNGQPCLDWYSSSWGQCSELCGGGEQQRMVTCPEPSKCDDALQPNSIQACNEQPCAQWVTGSWGQCSASCGGGVQRRLVKCVNTKTEQDEEDPERCNHEPWPENMQKCNLQECETAASDQVCQRDSLTFRFCQTLQWLGRCQLPTVRAQCCKTCGQRSRGNERISRR